MDKAGNLYGTTFIGGTLGDGAVYQLKLKNSSFVFNPLYSFAGGSDGANPEPRVIFGPDGALYGTTLYAGAGYGTVFKLQPPATACKAALCPWAKTELYQFEGDPDGAFPGYGDLIFYQGNIYGTTYNGGYSTGLGGTVYEMTPVGKGWTESVLYRFSGSPDGQLPANAVIFDSAGNLYSTTEEGGLSNAGTVFELSPSGSGWTEKVLYSFQGGDDGSLPLAGLIFDQLGNLYGATTNGGSGGGGTVFKLTPSGNGNWTYSSVYSFAGGTCSPYLGPWGNLVMDGAGNLYGTTYCDGANKAGNVWELKLSGNSWTYTSLHDFTGGNDGGNPFCNVVFDAKGNLYGTTYDGGSYGYGVVWEITP